MTGITRPIRALASAIRGTSTIEFAILAPVFILMMLGTMEACRLLYVIEAANTVAFRAARCLSIGTYCPTASATQTYVTTLSPMYSVPVVAGSIIATNNTTCSGTSGAAQVSFNIQLASAFVDIVPAFPQTFNVVGCFA